MNIGVIGLGKTGLAIACGLIRQGHDVLGVELSEKRRQEIGAEESAFEEAGCGWDARGRLALLLPGDPLVGECDLVILMVNTPEVAGVPGEIDLTAVAAASRDLASYSGIIVVSSTVLPGTCRTVIRPLLHPKALLAYSPVWLALGTVIRDYLNPPVVVVGCDGRLGNRERALFKEIFGGAAGRKYIYTDTVTAEAVKIMYNVWCTVKMAFVSETAEVFRDLGGDSQVMEDFLMAGGERAGRFLKSGPPFGGPCFPRDLRFAERVAGEKALLTKAVGEVNAEGYVRILKEVASALDVETVGVAGLSYKPGVPVLEESSSLTLIKMLQGKGYQVWGFDPLVKEVPEGVKLVSRIEDLVRGTNLIVEMHEGLVSKALEERVKVIRPWR